MSSTILGGDVTVYYLDENRQKRLEWSGSATGTRTANELYSALQDHFDEQGQMDDGIPMSAETPVEYTLGKIDAGDLDPWYVSYDMMEHITGGAIRTSGWARVTSTNTGIVVVPVTSNAIVAGDVGLAISGATTGSGTLLEVIEAGTTDYLVIRPDSSTAGDDFTTASQTITCNAHTASQSGAASFTGEQIWANFYTVTPIDDDAHVYLYQGTVSDAARARVYNIANQSNDWWPEGSLDRCIFIRDFKQASNPVIDAGYVTAFVRKGNTLYDSFELQASTTSGGRNPIPLSASNDLNQTTGYRSITVSGGSGNFSVGDEISGDTSGARGIITQIDNPGATATYHYYLIGDPQTDFNGSEAITNEDDTGTATGSGAPANQGPALATWFTSNTAPTISHGNTTFDTNDDGTPEGYGITIDCNQNPLTEVYEWLKYITRNGETSTTHTDGIEGEQYEGATVYLAYSGTVSGGTIGEGDDVTQATSGATGIVISHDTTLKQILLRNTRGTFNTANTVTSNDNSGAITPDTAATTFTPNKQSPFGSLAGGRFFGARGVLLSDYLASDENNFQLTDSQGNVRTRPQAYTITVTNLVGGAETASTHDRVGVFRLTGAGGSIDKAEYSAAGGEAIGDATIVVDTTITTDTPGKSTGGVLRIRDASDNNAGYRVRYSSWSGSTFTLANTASTATAGTTTTQISDSGATFTSTAKRGDLVYNTTGGGAGRGYAYVATVDSDTQLTLDRAITGQVSTDTYELNCVPIAIDTADDVWVPLLDKYATASSESVSIVVGSTIDYRVAVRNVANSTKIKPFTTDDAITNANRSVATIRTTDTIFT